MSVSPALNPDLLSVQNTSNFLQNWTIINSLLLLS